MMRIYPPNWNYEVQSLNFLVGKTVEQALSELKPHGYRVNIVEYNGFDCAYDDRKDPNRINVRAKMIGNVEGESRSIDEIVSVIGIG